MSSLGDFFSMTRHERRGTIVLLAVIAVLLLVMAVTRCSHRRSLPRDVDTAAIEAFEAQADSMAAQNAHQTLKRHQPRHKADKDKSKRKPGGDKKKKKSTRQPQAPHRLDPVPQF